LSNLAVAGEARRRRHCAWPRRYRGMGPGRGDGPCATAVLVEKRSGAEDI